MEERIRTHFGAVTRNFEDSDGGDPIVILPTCTKSSDEIVAQIRALIEAHRITQAQFERLQVTEESQLNKLIDGSSSDESFNEQFGIVRNVFKMFVQNDSSVFY